MSISKYFHTLRYLKPGQVRAQIQNRVRRALSDPEKWDPGVVPELPSWKEADVESLLPPVPLQDEEAVSQGDLSFLNVRRKLDWPREWQPQECPLLWTYNLHYHDWLWSLIGPHRSEWDKALLAVKEWIDRYPLSKGAAGWDAYPISLRLQNWVILFYLKQRGALLACGMAEHLWKSVWKQARWLEKNIEYHLRGNHLFENAATLALLGVVFSGDDAARWKRVGFKLVREQLAEQFLDDGMHFELSPMYHLRMLWLLEMLAALGDDELSGWVKPYLIKARKVDGYLRHPDGEIALLNDAAVGIYGNLETEESASPIGAWSLTDSGYYGYRSPSGDYIVCDVGQVGPDEQPGHAHADCLGFELSLGGYRVITDTGISDYEVSKTRAYTRSTSAHNTVEVEGQDQSEVWGAFRVARRARPDGVKWMPGECGFVLEAGHSGYQRLKSNVHHQRVFDFKPGRLKMSDTVKGVGSFRAVARLHFAPECEVSLNGGTGVIKWPQGSASLTLQGEGKVNLSESSYYEKFGVDAKRTVLEYMVDVTSVAEWSLELVWDSSDDSK